MYDIDYRENDVTAIDTQTGLTEQGADSPGAFVVPKHASYITEIVISVSADWTADAAEGFTSAIELDGPGLKAPKSWIGGPVGVAIGGDGVCGGMSLPVVQRIVCAIPVNAGQRISAYGYMHGSADMGSLRVLVTLVYDGPVKGKARYFDYREGDTAAANTLVTINGRGATPGAAGDFEVGSGQICDVVCATGLCPVAGPLAAGMAFHLTGTGLAVAGSYKFLSNSAFTTDDIASIGTATIVPGTVYKTSIAVQAGQIRCQCQEIEDDVGTPSHIITFGFL